MKKKKIYGKLLLDLVLLVLLALMYRKNAISMHFHETGGLVLCALFLVHKALNWQWIRSVTGAIFRRKAGLNPRWLVDVLLLVSMMGVLVTGLLIARTLPTAIAGGHGIQSWHYFFAAAALALSGIHLGLHGAYLKARLWNRLPLPEKAGKPIGVLLLCAVFLFGSFQLATSGFASLVVRPFVSITASREQENPGFAEMEHAPENGRAMGKGPGRGMGNGEGRGMTRPEHAAHAASPGNALSTFAAYASILCWFAIVTAAVSRRLQKRPKARRLP